MMNSIRLTGIVVLSAQLLAVAPAFGQMPSLSPDGSVMTSVPGISVFDDWRLVCPGSTGDARGCRAEPTVVRAETGPVPAVTILRDSDSAVMVLRAPLGLLLPQGVALSVDGRELGRLAFQTCEVDGCVAPVRLTGQVGAALRRGMRLDIELTSRDGERLQSTVSLLGITASIQALAE